MPANLIEYFVLRSLNSCKIDRYVIRACIANIALDWTLVELTSEFEISYAVLQIQFSTGKFGGFFRNKYGIFNI